MWMALIIMGLIFLVSAIVWIFDEGEIKIGAIVAIIGTIFLLVFFIFKPDTIYEQVIETQKIVASKDGNSIESRGYLFGGYKYGKYHYTYMYETEDGGYKYGEIKTKYATVYYTEENFRIEEYYNYERTWSFDYCDYECKIYIPYGSIVEEYEIDLE